ncbi:MAG: lysine--tRNA ligase, partial [Alphaproteobacteria bacterium]
SALYAAGRFDETLRAVLAHYDEIMAVMLPTLGAERQQTYSPFLPVSPATGRVLQVPVIARDVDAGTIVFEDEDGKKVETPVTGGRCKLQWKCDWAMRWVALGVDYEMSGKDLIDSVKASSQIARVLGARPPEGFHYELFLDQNGEKISKSKGNGLSIEEWLAYGPPESLSLFMYQQPRRAKRLYFDVIPRTVDDYLTFVEKYPAEPAAAQIENPVWHIHDGAPPAPEAALTFAVLLNLVGVAHAETKDVLWGFISRYLPGATPASAPRLDRLAGHAIRFYQDFVKPKQKRRPPTDVERAALADLADTLAALPAGADAEAIQNAVYEIGKRHPFGQLRDWFKAMYEVLFGQSEGPRMGSFIALYGVPETIALVRAALADADIAA